MVSLKIKRHLNAPAREKRGLSQLFKNFQSAWIEKRGKENRTKKFQHPAKVVLFKEPINCTNEIDGPTSNRHISKQATHRYPLFLVGWPKWENTSSDYSSVRGHLYLNEIERSAIARFWNFNAPKNCKLQQLYVPGTTHFNCVVLSATQHMQSSHVRISFTEDKTGENENSLETEKYRAERECARKAHSTVYKV